MQISWFSQNSIFHAIQRSAFGYSISVKVFLSSVDPEQIIYSNVYTYMIIYIYFIIHILYYIHIKPAMFHPKWQKIPRHGGSFAAFFPAQDAMFSTEDSRAAADVTT